MTTSQRSRRLPPRFPIPASRRSTGSSTTWFPLTYVLNNLNRGMGLPDGYPFVLSPPAVEKLKFVHETLNPESTRDNLPFWGFLTNLARSAAYLNFIMG